MTQAIIVPGLYDSGRAHWQSWIQERVPGAGRIILEDWLTPDLGVWTDAVAQAVERSKQPVVLVAHSYGCLAGYRAAVARADKVQGALFVAPADPRKFDYDSAQFASPLPFRSVLVASETDPWMSLARSRELAANWGSAHINLGNAGHINVTSGFGPWRFGLKLTQELAGAAPARQSLRESGQAAQARP